MYFKFHNWRIMSQTHKILIFVNIYFQNIYVLVQGIVVLLYLSDMVNSVNIYKFLKVLKIRHFKSLCELISVFLRLMFFIICECWVIFVVHCSSFDFNWICFYVYEKIIFSLVCLIALNLRFCRYRHLAHFKNVIFFQHRLVQYKYIWYLLHICDNWLFWHQIYFQWTKWIDIRLNLNSCQQFNIIILFYKISNLDILMWRYNLITQ